MKRKSCLRSIAGLPKPYAVSIKEGIQLSGKLDYSKADIRMSLDSYAQIKRLMACEKEPETVDWIETCCRSGDVFYDIGANVGAYSFIAHAVTGGDCKVYAFEPSFTTFCALSQNVMLNGCQDKIVPLHIALAEVTELLTFNYSKLAPGAATHTLSLPESDRKYAREPVFSQPIISYRLDDFIRQFGILPPDHIKIDVDGAELSVIRGAEETLARPDLRSLLIEIDEERDQDIVSIVEGEGFRVKSKHPRGVSVKSDTVFNYIFER